ncbi:TBC1 domain family member 30 [Gracilinanus agilis]|uniref:TBC1 domain family member 30 n=1 Tax=Gracilinanus agilis TaxID=191870 RepID=UPI001CFF063F|nr:TBC1 domain family member 30 [Gracilinanus agilis]
MRQDKLTSSLRRGGRCLKRQSGGGVGNILSNVLKKRSCISRTAPRLLCTLEPGEDPGLLVPLTCPGSPFLSRLEPLTLRVPDLPPPSNTPGIPKCSLTAAQTKSTLRAYLVAPHMPWVWLTLADHYLHSIAIDWDKTMRFTFNERSNPDDDSMGIQIVKDLHRTGCSSYCGQEAEQDRVVLKRVLLAYARWNKSVGYCQGFNILAALILEVMEGNEGDALKIMIYLIDKVLPESYFVNNLWALSVDMAVFRDLLRMKLPELSQHLDTLQRASNREGGGGYEPPLTNVFTMQWFLTLFATCLPNHTVLKIWDSVFFEGSEIILRVSLAIWAKLGEQIECCETADEFYSTMGRLTQEMLEDNLIESNELMQHISHALLTFLSDKGLVTSLLPSQVNHSPVINHLLLGKKLKTTNRAAKNAVIHIPGHTGSKLSPVPHEDLKTKLNSPWRTHIRVHRKNIARTKSQLGCGDTVGLIEEQNEGCKTSSGGAEGLPPSGAGKAGRDAGKAGRDGGGSEDSTSRTIDGQSPEPVFGDPSANLAEVQLKLEALELHERNAAETEPRAKKACPPHGPEPPILAKPPQASSSKAPGFSPFPSVKPLRKSTAARNLGLYGPTERTPTVHFPQMSRSFSKSSSANSGTKKR